MTLPDKPSCCPSLVLTREGSPEQAEALAWELVGRRLVACVNLLPVRSSYHWRGKQESNDEVKRLLKSNPELLPALRAAIEGLHS